VDVHFFGSVEYLRKEDERLEKEGFTGKKIATFIVCDRMESYVSYIRKYRPDIFETVSKDENGVEKESIYTYDGLNEEDEKFLKIIGLKTVPRILPLLIGKFYSQTSELP